MVDVEFEEESVGTGVYANIQQMVDWNPEAPGPDWRLVWLGETEEVLAAWFLRPLAITAIEAMEARA